MHTPNGNAASPSADPLRAACWIGGSFLALLTVLVVWAVYDRTTGTDSERFVKVSAVGDAPSFVSPATIDPATPLAVVEGNPLYPAGEPEAELLDSRMRPTGTDANSGAILYRCTEAEEQAYWFLKTGVNRYLRLTEKMPPTGR